MQLKLKVTQGKNAGQEINVPGPKFLIGRAEDCHLRAGSDAISRHHCVILIEEGYVGVRDFGSKNGTYVNQERIVGERPLKTNDILKVGPLEFEAHLDYRVGGKKRPKVKDVGEVAARITGGSGAAAERDIDISDWLGGDDNAEGDNATRDTQVGAGDTGSYSRKESESERPRADAAKAEPDKPTSEGEGPEKAKDSRSAAMDTLRRMQQLKQDKKPKK